MRLRVMPFRARRMSKKMAMRIAEAMKEAPVAPIEKLNQEAREFEKLILSRRASATKE